MSRPKKPTDRAAASSRPLREPQTSNRRPSPGTAPRTTSTRPSATQGMRAPVGATRQTSSTRTGSGYASGSASRPQTSTRPPSTARAGSASRPITNSNRPSASGARSSGSSTRPSTSGRPASNGSRPQERRPSTPSASTSKKRPSNPQRPTKRQKLRPRWGRWLMLIAVILLCVRFGPSLFDQASPAETVEASAQTVNGPLVSEADKAGFDETINSDSAILINVDNGDVLYEKDADVQRAPASLVKMMTVYVAIKHCDDVDRELAMPKDAFNGLEEGLASQSGLRAGELVTVRDLLYAAMLSSGGDAANALALITSGNINGFVDLMNQEAQHLGLDSTVFKNPTGLDAEGQVSTCRDMSRLVKGALGNSLFKEVFTARTYVTHGNEDRPEGLELRHTMTKDLNTFQRYFVTSGYEIVGGKTGYTEAAGNCLVTLANKSRAPEFVVVTMHATGTGDQYYQAFHDAVTLYGEAYGQIQKAPAEQDGSHE